MQPYSEAIPTPTMHTLKITSSPFGSLVVATRWSIAYKWVHTQGVFNRLMDIRLFPRLFAVSSHVNAANPTKPKTTRKHDCLKEESTLDQPTAIRRRNIFTHVPPVTDRLLTREMFHRSITPDRHESLAAHGSL